MTLAPFYYLDLEKEVYNQREYVGTAAVGDSVEELGHSLELALVNMGASSHFVL